MFTVNIADGPLLGLSLRHGEATALQEQLVGFLHDSKTELLVLDEGLGQLDLLASPKLVLLLGDPPSPAWGVVGPLLRGAS